MFVIKMFVVEPVRSPSGVCGGTLPDLSSRTDLFQRRAPRQAGPQQNSSFQSIYIYWLYKCVNFNNGEKLLQLYRCSITQIKQWVDSVDTFIYLYWLGHFQNNVTPEDGLANINIHILTKWCHKNNEYHDDYSTKIFGFRPFDPMRSLFW
jgi:hypothetical protein